MDWHQPEFRSLKGLGNVLETTSSKEAWQRFRCLGFDAVVIEKAAYTPAAFAQLSGSLRRDFGIAHPVFTSDRRAVYMLTPVPDGPAMCPSTPPAEAYKVEMPCPAVADFTPQGSGIEEMISGFYDSEPFGRWSSGNNSSFFCKFSPPQHPSKVKIVTRAFAPQGHNQRMRVTINRGQSQDFLYENGAEDKTIDMKIPPTAEGHFSIRFEFPDAVKPKDFGVRRETRKIAVSIRSITFE